jgi:uncharacterized protein (TIGR03086 family)
MDLLDCHRRALARTEELVSHVAPDRLGAPTPCPAWDVLALMNHLVLGNRMYAWCARGRSGHDFDVHRDFVGDDPVEAFLASARDIDRALSDPAVLERPWDLRFGRVPGSAAVAIHVMELVAHGWDLARATRQPLGMPADVVEVALATPVPEAMHGPGRLLADRIAVAGDAEPLDRLVAGLGRDPAWAPA